MKTKIITGIAFTLLLTAHPIVWAADINCSDPSSVPPSDNTLLCNKEKVTCVGPMIMITSSEQAVKM